MYYKKFYQATKLPQHLFREEKKQENQNGILSLNYKFGHFESLSEIYWREPKNCSKYRQLSSQGKLPSYRPSLKLTKPQEF